MAFMVSRVILGVCTGSGSDPNAWISIEIGYA